MNRQEPIIGQTYGLDADVCRTESDDTGMRSVDITPLGGDAQVRLLVTGGMGFIGSNFIRNTLEIHSDVSITNLDRLSYGSNPANLREIPEGSAYRFVRGDINDLDLVLEVTRDVNVVVNFAAETHVDRSISNPRAFHKANMEGVLNLLEACRTHDVTFLQVSTDEVYGLRGNCKRSRKGTRLIPHRPTPPRRLPPTS